MTMVEATDRQPCITNDPNHGSVDISKRAAGSAATASIQVTCVYVYNNVDTMYIKSVYVPSKVLTERPYVVRPLVCLSVCL